MREEVFVEGLAWMLSTREASLDGYSIVSEPVGHGPIEGKRCEEERGQSDLDATWPRFLAAQRGLLTQSFRQRRPRR